MMTVRSRSCIMKDWIMDAKDSNYLDEDHSNHYYTKIQLPLHMERDIMKSEHRKKIIPLLTMKRPMYNNLFL
jgi:hypothetical protein